MHGWHATLGNVSSLVEDRVRGMLGNLTTHLNATDTLASEALTIGDKALFLAERTSKIAEATFYMVRWGGVRVKGLWGERGLGEGPGV